MVRLRLKGCRVPQVANWLSCSYQRSTSNCLVRSDNDARDLPRKLADTLTGNLISALAGFRLGTDGCGKSLHTKHTENRIIGLRNKSTITLVCTCRYSALLIDCEPIW
jgi:hypothetical protein